MQGCLRSVRNCAPLATWERLRGLVTLAILGAVTYFACAMPRAALAKPPQRDVRRHKPTAQPASVRDASRSSELHASATSPQAQQEAIRAIAMDRIPDSLRETVGEVLDAPSLFRRLPMSAIDCDPELFTCLAKNPEILVEIWRELGVSKVELTRIGPSEYRVADGAGTTGKLVMVDATFGEAAQNCVTMYAEGSFEGKPFARPVHARCVLLLRSGSVVETNGRTFVASRLDSFIKFERPSVELAAKIIHPWVGSTADRNFSDTLTFIGNLSQTAEHRPESIEQLANKLASVDAARRREFVTIAFDCAERGRKLREERGLANRQVRPVAAITARSLRPAASPKPELVR